MEPPVRVEQPRMTKTSLFWLVVLVAGNITAFLLAQPTVEAPRQTPAANAYESRLTLLEELSDSERSRLQASREASAARTNGPPAAQEPVDEMVCRAWGPFGEPAQLETLQRQLEALGGAVEVRSSEVQGEPDFLVFIDTGNNLDTARRTLQELETQAVDAYIIAGGPYINSVSVGVFSRGERAEAQQRRVETLGYKSSVVELSRSQTVYHLIARLPESLDTLEDPGMDCQTIASIQ